ncbi:MAG: SAM-dependent methyltransferase [Micavibrio aeruginosavorus]|uniref:SAM-dependent methyltransferase n=1 Tax=Micavibrio aeruginosavorus TaxID=349221 RepID=A0A7T5R2V6_9BACT|nr:MAG: SAM-dependent methyltransferase [Micavibrio aeruginosavorus]
MAKDNPEPAFLSALSAALQDASFVKLSLGHYKGREEGLKQVHVRPIVVKRQTVLSFTYRYKTRDVVKNYLFDEALALVKAWLGRDFMTATLCTTQADLAFDGVKGRLKTAVPTHKEAPALSHDRAKARQVDVGAGWLHLLGITDKDGKVRHDAQDKYRQIDKYIETLGAQLKHIDVKNELRVVDMGAGKGYLTFALYDYLANKLGVKAEVTGVEYRADLVALCNGIAQQSVYTGLRFVQGAIEDYDATGVNVLIALHACDTATDDAIAKGVKAGADLIVVAPCCHKQIRREMEKAKAENGLGFLLRHGTFMERQAEMVTDGLRALLLEYEGYSAKVFEFISDAHTPKNVMIVAVRNSKAKHHDLAVLKKINEAKVYFGINRHHLEKNLEL